ncbi:hypothetical protein [Streptomyces alkaliphilus]|uniref:hypothetical protein n=1 Tax=Streptomyces alkaliphilus TaxID=1472722 RepID=UPI00117FBB7B|nr:hypothetical protein [Streptomyces alkaliphilus]MQS10157.1 hypothetical protein [Streptomyces alkaliphilus]
MTDRRPASDRRNSGDEQGENPFAPPPADAPDASRTPRGGDGDREGGRDGEGPDDRDNAGGGGLWSRRQPGRQGGGFGERRQDRPGGRPGPRWDPSDPIQRHARYAVLAGMWGVFAALLGWDWLALFLAAFGLYWGIDSLRGGALSGKKAAPTGPANRVEAVDPEPARSEAGEGYGTRPGGVGDDRGPKDPSRRPQTLSAIAGVVLSGIALAVVAAVFTVQMVYKDYFDCVEDSLTIPSREACEELLPEPLREIFSENA